MDAPGVYEVEVGTTVGDVLARSGLHADAGPLLIGGYFGTWHEMQDVAGLALAAPRCGARAPRRELAYCSPCRPGRAV